MKPIVLIQSIDAEDEFLEGPQPILQGRVPGPSRPRAGSHRDLRHFLSQFRGRFEILYGFHYP